MISAAPTNRTNRDSGGANHPGANHTNRDSGSANHPGANHSGANRTNRDSGGANHPGANRTNRDSSRANNHHSESRLALLRWTAGLGAVTADALAIHLDVSTPSARGHLRAAVAKGLVRRFTPLTDQPALYGVTRAGLRAVGVGGVDPCTVSAAGALHLIECARVAALLERCYPGHLVQGERQLRADERACGRLLASAQLHADGHAGAAGGDVETGRRRHRPDLVLWPYSPADGLPVAVEVELTVKTPARLAAICRAWARAGCVAGVLYLAPPDAERAVARAIERARAQQRVLVVPLNSLAQSPAAKPHSPAHHDSAERTVADRA